MENIDKLTLTKHAKERYAERIMKKDNSHDVNLFIVENEAKIEEDIKLMIQYGEEIFTGKPSVNNPKQHNCVYIINGLWIVVVDQNEKKIVTLYRINLGVGLDFDQEFKDRLMTQIHEAKTRAAETASKIESESAEYRKIISDNSAMINSLRQKIKNLEEVNESYSSVLTAANQRKAMAEDEIKDFVAILVGRTCF